MSALRGLEGMAGHQGRGGGLVDQVDLMAGAWLHAPFALLVVLGLCCWLMAGCTCQHIMHACASQCKELHTVLCRNAYVACM